MSSFAFRDLASFCLVLAWLISSWNDLAYGAVRLRMVDLLVASLPLQWLGFVTRRVVRRRAASCGSASQYFFYVDVGTTRVERIGVTSLSVALLPPYTPKSLGQELRGLAWRPTERT